MIRPESGNDSILPWQKSHDRNAPLQIVICLKTQITRKTRPSRARAAEKGLERPPPMASEI